MRLWIYVYLAVCCVHPQIVCCFRFFFIFHAFKVSFEEEPVRGRGVGGKSGWSEWNLISLIAGGVHLAAHTLITSFRVKQLHVWVIDKNSHIFASFWRSIYMPLDAFSVCYGLDKPLLKLSFRLTASDGEGFGFVLSSLLCSNRFLYYWRYDSVSSLRHLKCICLLRVQFSLMLYVMPLGSMTSIFGSMVSSARKFRIKF